MVRAASIALLVLAACRSGDAALDEPALSPQGWGPLRIGMSRSEVEAAVGGIRPGEGGWDEPELCDEFSPARAPEGLYVLLLDGRLDRISLGREARIPTDRGIRPGDGAEAVRRAHGEALSEEPHLYLAPDGLYLTAWSDGRRRGDGDYVENPAARGMRYEIGMEGRVEAIHAGGPSIQYVEGCA